MIGWQQRQEFLCRSILFVVDNIVVYVVYHVYGATKISSRIDVSTEQRVGRTRTSFNLD